MSSVLTSSGDLTTFEDDNQKGSKCKGSIVYGTIITEENGEDSKAVIVGKALEIPIISNDIDAFDMLIGGTMARVDDSNGYV